jgi:hypothetical protein
MFDSVAILCDLFAAFYDNIICGIFFDNIICGIFFDNFFAAGMPQLLRQNGHRLNAGARCPKYAQILVTRGDYRFTTFRTATTFPSATAFTK